MLEKECGNYTLLALIQKVTVYQIHIPYTHLKVIGSFRGNMCANLVSGEWKLNAIFMKMN